MPLVIEDGSLPAGANSFVSVAEVRAFAALRASTLPAADAAGDAAIEAACIAAMDYLDSLEERMKGARVSIEQSFCFPREGVYIKGFEFPEDEIPNAIRNAQCQLAIEAAAGVDLMPTGDGREVVKKKLDVLETEWKPGSGGAAQPVFAKALAFLAPLFTSGGSGKLTVGRI